MAAKAPPDGYTLLVVSTGFIVNPSMYGKIPYDPIKDFSPVTLVAAVVIRNTAVQLSSRFSVNSPNTTTNPEKIPIKLNTTCTKVKVIMSKIIVHIPCS